MVSAMRNRVSSWDSPSDTNLKAAGWSPSDRPGKGLNIVKRQRAGGKKLVPPYQAGRPRNQVSFRDPPLNNLSSWGATKALVTML